jgi:hypothetical protein
MPADEKRLTASSNISALIFAAGGGRSQRRKPDLAVTRIILPNIDSHAGKIMCWYWRAIPPPATASRDAMALINYRRASAG